MKLQSFSSRLLSARYLALALPLFALFSTAQAGCSGRIIGTGSDAGVGSSGGASGEPCVPTSYGGYGSYGYSGCD